MTVTEQLRLEWVERVELSPAQASWIEPHRVRFACDPRRNDNSEGCGVFGLCVLHAVGDENVRRHAQRTKDGS